MSKFLLIWIAAMGLVACQPVIDDDTVDPGTVLDPFEAAMEALAAGMTAHAAAVAGAADDAAIMTEEDSFAGSAAALFEECAHTAGELTSCSGMDAEAMDPMEVAGMFEGLEGALAAHRDAMDGAADKAAEEADFQAEAELHMGHGAELSGDMRGHAEAGELTCMMMGEHSE